jgi:PAS domain-containing protein
MTSLVVPPPESAELRASRAEARVRELERLLARTEGATPCAAGQARVEELVAAIPVPMILCDAQLGVAGANLEARHLLEAEETALRGRSLPEALGTTEIDLPDLLGRVAESEGPTLIGRAHV